ncbi:hypothetical protein GUJ93_ZPchr0007g5177 [Zizania palustris]|uniref:Uncharacterized protein n=1 Tax=Zizania palustris TaxID=103762 RepID=A0A8J5W4G4_ZIZPA|nr:hypothetical protein GUJ93_ZPchr0007g5177 [Zizania palustris]
MFVHGCARDPAPHVVELILFRGVAVVLGAFTSGAGRRVRAVDRRDRRFQGEDGREPEETLSRGETSKIH